MASKQFAKAAIPTIGDWVAGGTGLVIGTMGGQLSANANGIGTDVLLKTSVSSEIKDEFATALAQAGLDEMVAELYPGEAA